MEKKFNDYTQVSKKQKEESEKVKENFDKIKSERSRFEDEF